MPISHITSEFEMVRNIDKCISCGVCERICANDVHCMDEDGELESDSNKCVACQRCVTLCPTGALTVRMSENTFRYNANFTKGKIHSIYKQAKTGGVLLTSMGNPLPLLNYFDRILLNASQVTNPSIDPLREPMEVRTFLGRKPDTLAEDLPPQLMLKIPIMFSAMSYGSISLNAHASLARAAKQMGTFYNTGEGGLHPDLYEYSKNTIVQVASGRFGVHKKYLDAAAMVEIKIGQGAKPGIGGHLPGEKVSAEISATRMIPEGSDAISPAPHHDIYSIEDLSQLIEALKEATEYKKPISVKIAAVHNIAPIASGIVRAGADVVAIDGIRGGTGAAPTVIRDNVGIPIEVAIAVVDQRLRDEGIRNNASLVAAGGIRGSADIIKAIALGADAVYIGTSSLIALGCHMCQTCFTGKCNYGIATQDPFLTKRLNPVIGTRSLTNLLRAWDLEIKEMLGGMGINAIESLRGNREHLRGINMTDRDLKILGIKAAGEAW
jgi:glutamate synthase domain-containing protein 2